MNELPPTTEKLARRVRAMYNAHPFPYRKAIPPIKSDERFKYIYENFLHIPLADLKDKAVLDAGCGTGENTASWRRILDPSTRLIGVDLSAASIQIACRNARALPVQPVFAVNSLLDVGLATQSVDLVFCSGVLVAVPNPVRAFSELNRVLKPGGYMILVLYHRYGRAIHALRRAVIDLIERDDVDRRARLGGQLFGHSMRKLAEKEQVPLEGMLYDQFGLPCESRYSVGQALEWFKQAEIEYLGSWPPVEWSQIGKALRFSYSWRKRRNHPLFRLLLRIFADTDQPPHGRPGFFTRASMQTMWALNQQQLFAISGRKVKLNVTRG